MKFNKLDNSFVSLSRFILKLEWIYLVVIRENTKDVIFLGKWRAKSCAFTSVLESCFWQCFICKPLNLTASFYSTVYKSQPLYIFSSLELDGCLPISHSPRGFYHIIELLRASRPPAAAATLITWAKHIWLLRFPQGVSDCQVLQVWLLVESITWYNMIQWSYHYYDLLCLPKEIWKSYCMCTWI